MTLKLVLKTVKLVFSIQKLTTLKHVFSFRKLTTLKGEVRSIFIFWYFILYNMKILST